MAKVTERHIDEYQQDKDNLNLHTEVGAKLVKKSIEELGSGRSVVSDKNDVLIAGNLTTEQMKAAGITKVIEVETDGDALIVHKRKDLNLETDSRAKQLALADNSTAHVSYNIDYFAAQEQGEEFGFDIEEWGVMESDDEIIMEDVETGDSFSLPDGDRSPFQQMTFTLADEQAEYIKNGIADIKKTEEFKYMETMGNENSNGNALYLLVTKTLKESYG